MTRVGLHERVAEPPISASPRRVRKVLTDAGLTLSQQWTVAADALGFRFSILEKRAIDGPQLQLSDEAIVERHWVIGSVIVSEANGKLYGDDPDVWWLHASMAYTIDRQPPTHAEMSALKAAVFGPKRYAYSVWPAEADHVNYHPNALHIYGRRDGARLLPDFRIGGMI